MLYDIAEVHLIDSFTYKTVNIDIETYYRCQKKNPVNLMLICNKYLYFSVKNTKLELALK